MVELSDSAPLVTVVIPAYNQARFLGETLDSVLCQTYRNFEIVVVNDASTDNTEEVVRGYQDPRIRYMAHDSNKGLPATRNTGIRAARGEFVMLLDADDLFHRQKMEVHVEHLIKHPEAGVTYNARYELNYSSRGIRELVWPPNAVTLSDFVLGYPFTPSDTVLRKDWIARAGYFDERCVNGGEDLELPVKLLLAGCRFSGVKRALNYRRHHPGRHRKNLKARMEEVLWVLETIFSDPRCPPEVKSLRDKAHMTNYLGYAYYAFIGGDTALGQSYIAEAARLKPDILEGSPCPAATFFMASSISDDTVDHQERLKEILSQVPPQMQPLASQYNWMAGRGFLLKGTRAAVWENPGGGDEFFARAWELGAEIDESYLRDLSYQLTNYETEFGAAATRSALRRLKSCFRKMKAGRKTRLLQAHFSAGRAFHYFENGEYSKVAARALNTIANDPRYLLNRGLLAVLFRSVTGVHKRTEPETRN